MSEDQEEDEEWFCYFCQVGQNDGDYCRCCGRSYNHPMSVEGRERDRPGDYPYPIGPRPSHLRGPGEIADCTGIPIYPGDLLRTFHYTAALRRRTCYLYHVVVLRNPGSCDQGLWAVPAGNLEPSRAERLGESGTFLLCSRQTSSEIISGYTLDSRGVPLDWYERRRILPPLESGKRKSSKDRKKIPEPDSILPE